MAKYQKPEVMLLGNAAFLIQGIKDRAPDAGSTDPGNKLDFEFDD